ncbi:MAG: response regulator [Nitrospirota bacterium]|jgi:excisionase family DNA binding protein
MNEDLLMSLPVDCSTRDVAQVLGMAVRSVQLMVDRGELEAWKTPGGHRRIARASVERWLKQRNGPVADAAPAEPAAALPVDRAAATQAGSAERGPVRRPRVLLIEDSAHFQNLVQLLVAHGFPQVDLHVAEDGIVGLAMAGELQPDVLIVDILLPGIDGATLIARLRSHPQFQRSRLIVVTSLDDAQRAPYAFALEGLPVVHKPHLVQELPVLLARYLGTVD